MITFKVGQFNTGCENFVKARLQELLPEDLGEAFGEGAEVTVTVSHSPQPKFNDIGVILHVKLGRGHYQNSSAVTVDEVRNFRGPQLDGMIQTRMNATILEMKTLIDKVQPPR